MERQIGVRVTYRNHQLTPTSSRIYGLPEYTAQIRSDLQKIVSDVEALCYDVNDGKPIEEWSEETFQAFTKIKHKLLDKAGDIGRLPENLVISEKEPLNEFVARLINEGG